MKGTTRSTRLVPALFIAGVLICLPMAFARGQGQTQLLTLPDSAIQFTIDQFYTLVLSNHPIAKQTKLLSELARQEIRLARGNFDPKIEAQYLAKEFNETDYYRIFNGNVKFPLLLPFDPVVGAEKNTGDYLNPERYVSKDFNNWQVYSGVALPIGRGLITDERRAALNHAKLFGDMVEAERIKLINKLMLDAAKDYWQWAFSYYNYRLHLQSVAIASEIFNRVKLNNELGEAAVVDTIHAKIILQQRRIETQEAFLEFQNTGIELSNYLWDSLNNPLQLADNYAPVISSEIIGITRQELEELLSLSQANHPELRKLSVKMQQLEIDRKLHAEFLKPKLDFSYYFLNQPFNPDGETSLKMIDDYKIGVDFSFPIFLRKERAKLAQTKLKISSTQFEQSLAERGIMNQVIAAYNDMLNNAGIISQQSEMVNNYQRLLEAELLNIELGESDLFKINFQQEKLIQSQSKLIKLLAEYQKQKAFLYWAAGLNGIR